MIHPMLLASADVCTFASSRTGYAAVVARTYTQSTIKLLFGTATHCAYPGCTARLIFMDRGLLTPTVEIAHIRSEKSDGPRYDATYQTDKINHFENLLLLCGGHHAPVDHHESAYSVEELLEWKKQQTHQGERVIAGAELAAIERILNRVQPIASDAVLRGPVAALGQAERLQQAEDRVVDAPLEAAMLFDEVARALEASPFVHHASIVRTRQSRALEAGGDYDSAAALRIELGWRAYHAGDVFAVRQQIREIFRNEGALAQSSVRAAGGLSYAAAFGYERKISIEQFAQAFDGMLLMDQGYMECAVAFAEQATAWHRPDLLIPRTEPLAALADATPGTDAGLAIRARIRICLAEATADWDALLHDARLVFPPLVVAWISARHARYLGIIGRPDEAIQRWQDAIDGAVQAGANDSAAVWLYALRATRMQYHILDGDLNDLHRLAQALRAAGTGSVLPEPYPLAERAAARMLDQKWPDALQCLYRQLGHAVITANWVSELAAHERFGDLFSATEKWDEAVAHYLRSGRSQKLQGLAKTMPDQPLPFEPPQPGSPIWERIAAYKFAAAAAEVLPGEVARKWAEVAGCEIMTKQWTGPYTDTWLPAFEAFAANADEASRELAARFLDFTADYFQREPGTHLQTDEAHLKALAAIAELHEDLRARAADVVCDAILVGNEVGEWAIAECGDVLRGSSGSVASRLADAASSGKLYAALALIIAGADPTSAIDFARDRLAERIQPLVISPGVTSVGTDLRQTALLVSILDEPERQAFIEAMLLRALEERDAEANRADALSAILMVGPSLSARARTSTFDALFSFAHGPTASAVSFGFADDPFSRFKVSLGDRPLAALAVQAAGSLAHTEEQHEAVQRFVVEMLPAADDHTCFVLARTLSNLPAEILKVDVELLGGHGNRWLRCFAATAWARAPQRWPGLGERLGADSEPSVRMTLASCLTEASEHELVRSLLRADHRREIARLVH